LEKNETKLRNTFSIGPTLVTKWKVNDLHIDQYGILSYNSSRNKESDINLMSLPAEKIRYPYISSNSQIAGGAPIIEGTRITVRTIAGYYQMGMDVNEILETLSHLSPAQVHSALAYYFDNQREIDADWCDSTDVESWKQKALKHPHEDLIVLIPSNHLAAK